MKTWAYMMRVANGAYVPVQGWGARPKHKRARPQPKTMEAANMYTVTGQMPYEYNGRPAHLLDITMMSGNSQACALVVQTSWNLKGRSVAHAKGLLFDPVTGQVLALIIEDLIWVEN